MVKKIKNRIASLYRKDKELFYVLIIGCIFILWLVVDKQFFAFDRVRKQHETTNAAEIIHSQELRNGDYIYICGNSTYDVGIRAQIMHKDDYKPNKYSGLWSRTASIYASVSKQNAEQFGWKSYSSVHIFYPQGQYDPYRAGSFYTWFEDGREIGEYLICVTPIEIMDGNTLLPYPYSVDEWDIPQDTIGTDPVQVVDENGYPAWYFIISADELRSDYILFYGDHQLTYHDLTNFTWTEN